MKAVTEELCGEQAASRHACETSRRPVKFLTTIAPLLLLAVATIVAAAPDASSYERAVVRVVVASETDAGLVFGSGTGFFINERYVVTNQHVAVGARSSSNPPALFIVLCGTDEPLPVSVVWSDERLDLALLEYDDGVPHGALPIAAGELREGSDVYAVGYPGSADLMVSGPAHSTLTDGILSRPPFEARWGSSSVGLALILQHTADINPGNSGGPLLDACGGVVGVNTGGGIADVRDADGNVVGATTAQGIFFALHVSELAPVLDGIGANYNVAAACDGGRTLPVSGSSPPVPHPLTIALLASILLAVTVLLFRRPRQVVTAAAGRSIGAAASAVIRASVKGAPAPGTPKFTGRHGTPDFALDAGTLRRASHGLSVGRYSDLVDYPLQVEGLSRRHFRVSTHRGRMFIEDLNSTNGTIVNGARLQPYHGRQLKDGDIIAAGSGRWHFRRRE